MYQMGLKNLWNQFCDKYMKDTTQNIDTSRFPEDEIIRYRIVFSGLVQGVGFRYETWAIAQKLGLTGFVENLPNGDVHAQIQGPRNRIMYLIECLKSIPRIQIADVQMEEIEQKEELHFEIAN